MEWKNMKRLVLVVVALSFFMWSVTAYADHKNDAKELVEKAVQFFSEKGMDYALKVVGTSNGPLRKDGGLYVFAFKFDGTGLAHPYNPNLLGSQWNLQDTNGKYVIQDFVAIAKDAGSGWSEYYWNKPGETKPVLKITYVMRVPGEEILIGCGYYVE
jgi:cytochrome c